MPVAALRLVQDDLSLVADSDLLALACPEGASQLIGVFPIKSHLLGAAPRELAEAGLPHSDALRLAAAFEFYRRANLPSPRRAIDSPTAAAEVLRDEFMGVDCERILALALDRANHLIASVTVAEGCLDRSGLDPRVLFGRLLKLGAASFVLAHNHPSGSTEPSAADLATTRRIAEGAALLSLDFIDHLLFGDQEWISFQEKGMIHHHEHLFDADAVAG